MLSRILKFRHSLAAKVIFGVGLILLLSSSGWAYFSVRSQREKALKTIVASTDRLTHTIRLGTHYAMMFNSRDDITQIINNIAKLEEIQNIRIYNKAGQIQFSNRPAEVEQVTNIKDEACYICHRTDPPSVELALSQRTRIFSGPDGQRSLGVITPIYNEPSCVTDCHVHPQDKRVLGALDVVVSLAQTDLELGQIQRRILGFALSVFMATAAFIVILFVKFVNQPVGKLISGTRRIAQGDYPEGIDIHQTDEMGQLAQAVAQMGQEIRAKETELNQQRGEYQELFERVPCFVTVQNRNYELIGYNREFADRFDPDMGDFCYHAYKDRAKKCRDCPVEKTFVDGQSHQSYETGVGKDGQPSYWLVKTAPIKNNQGEIVA
ncbi:MAG: HAMP domain-containing protein, partial [Desulfobacterales bacterium]